MTEASRVVSSISRPFLMDYKRGSSLPFMHDQLQPTQKKIQEAMCSEDDSQGSQHASEDESEVGQACSPHAYATD
jgi:hypothetical protein